MSRCWNITWLYIYLAILFLHSSCYLLLLSNQSQSVYSFIFRIPTKIIIKKTKTFPSQHDIFKRSTGSTQKSFLFANQLISQLRENVSSFHFLANAIIGYDLSVQYWDLTSWVKSRSDLQLWRVNVYEKC